MYGLPKNVPPLIGAMAKGVVTCAVGNDPGGTIAVTSALRLFDELFRVMSPEVDPHYQLITVFWALRISLKDFKMTIYPFELINMGFG